MTAAIVIAAGVLPAGQAAAVDGHCLEDPVVGDGADYIDHPPILTTKDEQIQLTLSGVSLEPCPATTATVRTPVGATVTVPLDQAFPGGPDRYPWIAGTLDAQLATGSGTWNITAITSDGQTRPLHHPFQVRRGSIVTLDNPAPTTAPARVAVAGTVRQYTPTGSLTPSAGQPVTVYRPGRTDLAHLTSGTDGTFRGTVALPPGSTPIVAEGPYGTSGSVQAVVEQATQAQVRVTRLVPSATAYVNRWWRLDGTVSPGVLWHDLQIRDETG